MKKMTLRVLVSQLMMKKMTLRVLVSQLCLIMTINFQAKVGEMGQEIGGITATGLAGCERQGQEVW